MEEFKQISDKLDKMSVILTEVRISQGRTEVDVSTHIKRTDLLEESVTMLRADVAPLQIQASQLKLVSRIFVWVMGAIVTVAAAVLKFRR